MNKRIIAILILLMLAFTVTGCDLEESGVTLKSETVGTIGEDKIIEIQDQEMSELCTKHNIKFGDYELKFSSVYSLEKSRAENWLFTQPSSIDLSLNIEKIPDNIDVMVSQVYGDISLLSLYAKYNGIRQDSINIIYNDLPTGGVSIRESDPFTMPFQIEGVDKSETFYYMFNGYGSSDTYRITESKLAANVQGAVLNVVWTILIKDKSVGSLYIKTINDRVGIPYNRTTNANNESE